MRHCAKARNLKGMGSRAGAKVGERNGGGGELEAETGATSIESVMEGWRLGGGGGEGKRGGLKGSLAEILGKSSVKSHQNIPLAKTTTYSYHHCPLVSVVSA